MTTISEHTPRRRDDVAVVDRGDHSVLIVVGDDSPHVLNPTARALWDLCDGVTTVEEVVAAMCAVFDVDRATAETDIRSALARFADAGLLREGTR